MSKRAYNHDQVWAKEYVATQRNPKTYYKLSDGSWNFDILNDMLFSFWVMTPLSSYDFKCTDVLAEQGIHYRCSCPKFLVCMHAFVVECGASLAVHAWAGCVHVFLPKLLLCAAHAHFLEVMLLLVLQHYHVCVHVLAVSIGCDDRPVPTKFSTKTCGKRKAPAGASLSKRGHCLLID